VSAQPAGYGVGLPVGEQIDRACVTMFSATLP
jgi:hypothetical protein